MSSTRFVRTVPAYTAQLATLVESAPRGDEWLHEQKFDGYRIGIRIDDGQVRLWSRRAQDWTAEFPTVANAAAALGARTALLDGEVVLVPAERNLRIRVSFDRDWLAACVLPNQGFPEERLTPPLVVPP